MTKKEMVKELVKYEVIEKNNEAYVLRMAKSRIERIYKEALPIRKVFLEGKG